MTRTIDPAKLNDAIETLTELWVAAKYRAETELRVYGKAKRVQDIKDPDLRERYAELFRRADRALSALKWLQELRQ